MPLRRLPPDSRSASLLVPSAATMERSPSRLRNAGGFVASGGSMAGTPESQYSERGSLVRRSTRAADHSRGQVQSALDGLLSDDDYSQRRSPSRGYDPVDGARSPGPPTGGRRRSFNPPDPISLDSSYPHRDQSPNGLLSPTRKASAVTPDGGGYTPTAAGGRR